MLKTLVIAPHPDDEMIGCGGTLLRRNNEGVIVGWLIVTQISEEQGWNSNDVRRRNEEIEKVRYGLDIHENHLFQLGYPTTKLDIVPLGDLIQKMSDVFNSFHPEEVLIPHYGDVHSDHRIVFDSVSACTKWFRYPFVKRIMAYESLSETDYNLDPEKHFHPNLYVDIKNYLDKKVDLLKQYESEISDFPFPRSELSVRALAQLRGSQSGFLAAEAFQLLMERT